jgi:hypothetical protein
VIRWMKKKEEREGKGLRPGRESLAGISGSD